MYPIYRPTRGYRLTLPEEVKKKPKVKRPKPKSDHVVVHITIIIGTDEIITEYK